MSTQEAYDAGYAHAMAGNGISGRFAYTGTARGYWEAGFAAGTKAAKAAYDAPEAKAKRAEDNAKAVAWLEDTMLELAVSLHTGRM
jgi:hypothetical protein